MKNIVLTGGPCAGKTTALASLKECLEERGYQVFIVEESATELINKGIRPFGENAIPLYDFQKIIINYQLKKELLVRLKAKLIKNSIIIYDRGVIDNKSYLDEISWYRILEELNLNEAKLMNRYDQIIHMVTAADGKPEYYTTENNEARSEDVSLARKRDINTLNAYIGHHNLKVTDNSTDFNEKINKVKNYILAELNEPLCYNNQYKFQVDLSKTDLDKLKCISSKAYIEQTYLKSSDDIDRKIRKKIIDGNVSYYLIEKRRNNHQEEIKTKKVISKLEYLYYLRKKDINIEPIRKLRYSFRYEKEVYNLDLFEDMTWAILECETTKNLFQLNLPDFLEITGIEQNNNKLYNKEIAKKKKLQLH